MEQTETNVDFQAAKMSQMLEILQQREVDRKEKIRKDKADKEANSNELTLNFNESFSKFESEILLDLDNLQKAVPEQLEEFSTSIDEKIKNLQTLTLSSLHFFSVYYMCRFQERIDALVDSRRQLGQSPQPRIKLSSFRTAKQARATLPENTMDTVDAAAAVREKVRKMIDVDQLQIGFSDKSGEYLTLGQEISGKDVSLSRLQGCVVSLTGGCNTMHISGLTSCTVLAGPVSTSVFVDSCADCKFVMACQQLRIHSTRKCDFYVCIKSRSIIEDTSDVRFAPYCWSYPNIELHFQQAGQFDRDNNNWDLVDDFNCPSSVSENWTILREDQRESFDSLAQ